MQQKKLWEGQVLEVYLSKLYISSLPGYSCHKVSSFQTTTSMLLSRKEVPVEVEIM